MKHKSVSNEQILEAVNELADAVASQFGKVDGRFDNLEYEAKTTNRRLENLEGQVADLRHTTNIR